jgi:hypothetical protein
MVACANLNAMVRQVEPDICSQIKDPARNGNRTIAQIVEHIEHELLVHWGWTPGPGRESAPYSAAQLIERLKQWDAAGTPYPTKKTASCCTRLAKPNYKLVDYGVGG